MPDTSKVVITPGPGSKNGERETVALLVGVPPSSARKLAESEIRGRKARRRDITLEMDRR